MRVIFFWKCWKPNAYLKNAQENWEKTFCFWEKSIWIVSIELSLLRTEYISSAVNALIKSLQTLHVSNSDFFQLNYLHSDQSIWLRRWHWDWMSVSASLPCRLSRIPLKREFLDIYLSKPFAVRNFGNTEAMRVILFWKVSKFNSD